MSANKPSAGKQAPISELRKRINAEIQDNFDEDIELELEDSELAELLSESEHLQLHDSYGALADRLCVRIYTDSVSDPSPGKDRFSIAELMRDDAIIEHELIALMGVRIDWRKKVGEVDQAQVGADVTGEASEFCVRIEMVVDAHHRRKIVEARVARTKRCRRVV